MWSKKRKIGVLVLVIALAGTGITALVLLPNPLKKGWSGAILADTTWGPGEVVVSGDVFVASGVTLTIKPGTVVKVLAGSSDLNLVTMQDADVDAFTKGDPTADPSAGGNAYHRDHNIIIVRGSIRCVGTANAPIIITSSRALTPGQTPFYTDWVGLNVHDGEFAYTAITWCIDPVYSDNGYERLRFDHCYVAHSWAAAVGWMEPNDGAKTGNAFIKHSTIRDFGHEAIDTHSSGHLEVAYCDIAVGQVGLNFHADISGAGNHLTVNAHHNRIWNASFPVLATDGAVVDLEHNLLESARIATTRWTYKTYTMPSVLGEGDDAAILCPPGDCDAAGTTVTTRHNIFYQSTIGIRRDSEGISVSDSYNNYDQCTKALEGPGLVLGAGTMTVNSGFVDTASGNFQLGATSPLRGAGDPDASAPDIGLYGGAGSSSEIGWIPTGYDAVL